MHDYSKTTKHASQHYPHHTHHYKHTSCFIPKTLNLLAFLYKNIHIATLLNTITDDCAFTMKEGKIMALKFCNITTIHTTINKMPD